MANKTAQLKTLKKGEYFKRIIRGKMSRETYTKGSYDRSTKRFDCQKHSDAWGAGVQIKGETKVAVGFTY